ncbi:hypothetical protein LWI28_029063 [Acer negundo]|uniref:Uncharacterized protein n=1 Tax=Acer negundo TaxID=4023 RepID=A0AAD5IB22_ACENE|nr:hypothetical protein LWI28_029063 [Acer negundo]
MDSNEVDIDNFAFESENMEDEYDGDTQVENTGGDMGKGKKVVQSKPSRKRKETSKVWKVFVKLPRGKDGRLRCKCKGCTLEALEVDEVAEDILKLTLENNPDPFIESATSQFCD